MSEKGKELILAKSLAKSRGGKCLSRKYVSSKNKMKWECEQGHKWEAAFGEVKGTKRRKGTWCPYCHNRVDKENELENCAKGRPIKSLSQKYDKSSSAYQWKCLECAHVWESTHNHCVYLDSSVRGKGYSKKLIESAIEFAKSRGAQKVLCFPIPPENRDKFPEGEAEFSGRHSTYKKLGFLDKEKLGDFYQVVELDVTD